METTEQSLQDMESNVVKGKDIEMMDAKSPNESTQQTSEDDHDQDMTIEKPGVEIDNEESKDGAI